MSEQIHEAMSAAMDDEANDLDLRRILNAVDEDPDALARWDRYHLVSAMLRESVFTAPLRADPAAPDGRVPDRLETLGDGQDEAADAAIAANVVAIATKDRARPAHGPSAGFGLMRAGAGFSVAAAVTLAVMMSLPTAVEDVPAAAGPELAVRTPAASFVDGPVGALPLQAGTTTLGPIVTPPNQSPAALAPTASTYLDTGAAARERLAREQLDAYFLHHVEHAALNNRSTVLPFVKMAAFSSDL